MSDRSAIEWTETTWNPTTGCDRISAGCDHCYALILSKRLKAMGSAKYQTDGDPRTSGPGFGVATHQDMVKTSNVEVQRRDGRRCVLADSLSSAVSWLCDRVDEDPDGLLTYRRINPRGIENQTWRDSWDSLSHVDGSLPNHNRPVAALDVQILAHDGLLAAARHVRAVNINRRVRPGDDRPHQRGSTELGLLSCGSAPDRCRYVIYNLSSRVDLNVSPPTEKSGEDSERKCLACDGTVHKECRFRYSNLERCIMRKEGGQLASEEGEALSNLILTYVPTSPQEISSSPVVRWLRLFARRRYLQRGRCCNWLG
jgi:hypothetical protein